MTSTLTSERARARIVGGAADAGKFAAGRMAFAFDALLGPRAAGRAGILYYHRVTDLVPGVPPPTLNVTPEAFRRQIVGLVERGFEFRTVGWLLERSEGGQELPPRTASITFDDGYRGVYEHAWSVLRDLGVPATLFVATAFPDGDRPFPFDPWGLRHAASSPREAWAPLTWEQCREMAADGLVEIASHTHTHADFRGRPEAFGDDLDASLLALDDHLERWSPLLSFPFGNVRAGFAADDLVGEARKRGIRGGLTTAMGLVTPGEDPFRWGRFEAVGSDSPATLAAKLDGWYDWMDRGRRWFRAVTG